MEFFSREIREPDEGLLRMLTQVGAHIGQFMERKRAEEDLERFFTLSLDLLCLAGFDGYFKRVNPAWERVLGYTTEELLARPYLDFVHPDDRNPTTTEADKLGDGGNVLTFENRYIAKDGTYRWLQWNAVSLPSEQMIYAAARDITERKQAKETIARYSRDLKASREAEAANASRLAKLVSELEVRNLLNVVQSALNESGEPQAIEVVSAVPGWVELIVPCTREAAEQIQQVVERLGADLPEDVLESVVLRVSRAGDERGRVGRRAGSVPQSPDHLRAHRSNADVSHRRSRARAFTFDESRSRRGGTRQPDRPHAGPRAEGPARRRLRRADGASQRR